MALAYVNLHVTCRGGSVLAGLLLIGLSFLPKFRMMDDYRDDCFMGGPRQWPRVVYSFG